MKRIIDSEYQYIIGPQIKKARGKAGISQKQLSEKLELMAVYTCKGSISRIENGRRAVTDIETDAISKVLNVSLDYLFGREKNKRVVVWLIQQLFFVYIYSHIITLAA